MKLMHYGIKGTHWGVRRYQNIDGSLTPEGREHYGVGVKTTTNLLTGEEMLTDYRDRKAYERHKNKVKRDYVTRQAVGGNYQLTRAYNNLRKNLEQHGRTEKIEGNSGNQHFLNYDLIGKTYYDKFNKEVDKILSDNKIDSIKSESGVIDSGRGAIEEILSEYYERRQPR